MVYVASEMRMKYKEGGLTGGAVVLDELFRVCVCMILLLLVLHHCFFYFTSASVCPVVCVVVMLVCICVCACMRMYFVDDSSLCHILG